ncbi:hypothetical protein [Pyrofollis japonicus]|uniref:hypothetical protein n=1 Tax=Pyrofollis japonicus TaxID=3060460 RepID=UPI00295BFF19|nr:hypothetical protein [Pyrofollis japonicus]
MPLMFCEDKCIEKCSNLEHQGFETYNECVEECIYHCAVVKDLKIINNRDR